MPNITQTSDFDVNEEVFIPNAVSGNAGEGLNKKLDSVITKYERKILLEVLGKDQYNVLQTELEKLPFNTQASEAAATKYVNLVNGLNDWEGIRPMLLYFIFCHWLRTDEVKVGTVGSGKGQKEGYTIADRTSDYAQRWNDFISELSDLEDYLEESVDLELVSDFPVYDTENALGF